MSANQHQPVKTLRVFQPRPVEMKALSLQVSKHPVSPPPHGIQIHYLRPGRVSADNGPGGCFLLPPLGLGRMRQRQAVRSPSPGGQPHPLIERLLPRGWCQVRPLTAPAIGQFDLNAPFAAHHRYPAQRLKALQDVVSMKLTVGDELHARPGWQPTADGGKQAVERGLDRPRLGLNGHPSDRQGTAAVGQRQLNDAQVPSQVGGGEDEAQTPASPPPAPGRPARTA